MKHYICVEEHEITYACGTYKTPDRTSAKGTIVLQEWECVKADGDTSDIFEKLSEKHHLEGRKVTLVLGRDIAVCKVKLPRARERELRHMARNELTAAGKCGVDSLAAADIQRSFGGSQIPVMVYYMDKSRLELYIRAMEQAGMVYERTLLVPDCVAAASYMMCRSRAGIIVDVENESLNLYGVSGGHCLAWKSSSLKPGRFLEMGAEELLYEEIAEQTELLQKQMETDSGKCVPECLVLTGNCFPNKEHTAAYLEERLKLPCTNAVFHIASQIEPETISCGALAAIAAGGRPGRRLLKLDSGKENRHTGIIKGVTGAVSRGGALFLAANILAAAGVCGYMGILRHRTSQELSELKAVMDDAAYREQYQKLSRMDRETEEKAARRSAEELVRKDVSGNLEMKAYNTFTDALEPGMQVESVVYEADQNTLELVISMDTSAQIPAYVDRVSAFGTFGHVSHSLWEKNEEEGMVRVYASVRAFLTEGGQDEAK